MVSLKILDVKTFMSSLLIQTTFDNFQLSELELATYNQFKIAGRLNKSWYSNEELEQLDGREYSKWSELKPVAFQLIKGNKTPSSFKIVFLLSRENIEKLLSKMGNTFSGEDIDNLFLNIRFEKDILTIITGTSMKTFSLNKSLEQEWDQNVKAFLKKNEIVFEEN